MKTISVIRNPQGGYWSERLNMFGEFNVATQYSDSNRLATLATLEGVVKLHGFAELVALWMPAETAAARPVDPQPPRFTKTAAPPTNNGYKPYGAI